MSRNRFPLPCLSGRVARGLFVNEVAIFTYIISTAIIAVGLLSVTTLLRSILDKLNNPTETSTQIETLVQLREITQILEDRVPIDAEGVEIGLIGAHLRRQFRN